MEQERWQDDAACLIAVDTPPAPVVTREDEVREELRQRRIRALFQPSHAVEYDARGWLQYCGVCAVRRDCLKWGIQEEEHGVWGGLHERERDVLRTHIANRRMTIDEALEYAEQKFVAREPVARIRRKKRRLKPAGERGGYTQLGGS